MIGPVLKEFDLFKEGISLCSNCKALVMESLAGMTVNLPS